MPYTRLSDIDSQIMRFPFSKMCLHFSFAIILMALAFPVAGQQVMQIETYGKAKSKKIFAGQSIQYQLRNQKDTWLTGTIEGYRMDERMIVMADRYVHVDSIAALRYNKKWSKAVGTQMFWFGTAWSAFAAGGTLTDGNPDTNYQWSDAAVTGGFWLGSFLLPRIFRYRYYKMDGRHRLRLLDLQPFQGLNRP